MSQRTEAGPASKAKKMFTFRQQSYVLPDMKAMEVRKVQPNDLMVRLKASNSRLPPEIANVEFLSAAFGVLLRQSWGVLTNVEWRQAKYQWKESFRAYKADFKKRESTTPGTQQNAQTRHKENIVIGSQNWWISNRYETDLRGLGFPKFGSSFISMNQNHPRQDFTPSVLVQAFDAYVTRFPNASSEVRQEVMQRKKSKRARMFLGKCGRLAAEAKAKARAEMKAANCSADSSSSGSETETEGTETRNATDRSDADTEDDMESIVPAADSSAASTSTESDHEQMSEGSSDDSSYDKMSINDDRQDEKASPRKRRRESTSPPSTHDVLQSHHTHSPRAKRLRVATTQAKSPTPASSSPSTDQYGPGRDIFSALEDYLNLCSDKYKVEITSMG